MSKTSTPLMKPYPISLCLNVLHQIVRGKRVPPPWNDLMYWHGRLTHLIFYMYCASLSRPVIYIICILLYWDTDKNIKAMNKFTTRGHNTFINCLKHNRVYTFLGTFKNLRYFCSYISCLMLEKFKCTVLDCFKSGWWPLYDYYKKNFSTYGQLGYVENHLLVYIRF